MGVPTPRLDLSLEATYLVARVAGVDEAGRGPLAGPVVAAACVIARDSHTLHDGVNDSKRLSAEEREALFESLTADPTVGYAVSVVGRDVIDDINILQATMRAMSEAVHRLPASFAPELVLVDGPRCPDNLPAPAEPLVKGDSRCYSIAAASIIAKVTRDRLMLDLHGRYPGYGFDRHMGYGTKEHVNALHRLGPTPEHRLSFNPLRDWLSEGGVAGWPGVAPAKERTSTSAAAAAPEGKGASMRDAVAPKGTSKSTAAAPKPNSTSKWAGGARNPSKGAGRESGAPKARSTSRRAGGARNPSVGAGCESVRRSARIRKS